MSCGLSKEDLMEVHMVLARRDCIARGNVELETKSSGDGRSGRQM